jgi:branched-chain amino acid transport system substrate-binding protein
LLTGAFVAAAFAAAAPLQAQQKTIRVGFPIIMSGAGAQFGIPPLKGAQMYAEEVNAKGGVLGRKIEIIPRDTKSRPDEAVRVARELIVRENVDFLVGTFTRPRVRRSRRSPRRTRSFSSPRSRPPTA